MEVDNINVINALNNRANRTSTFYLILEDMLCLINYFDYVWYFVKRSGNKVVYYMAHLNPLEVGRCCWCSFRFSNIIFLSLWVRQKKNLLPPF